MTITVPGHELRLFDDPADLESRVRSNDPDTSWRAASNITRADNETLKDAIYRILLTRGPMTDDALAEAYLDDQSNPPRTPQRIRTARAEMARDRNLRTQRRITPRVQLAVGLGTSDHGGDSQRWEAIS
ncbi:MAG: hypothetical protein ABIQ01_04890 [Pseudolysinimonas sp.]